MTKKILATLSVILAILFIVLAFVYWFTPAGALPHFLPGFIAGSTAPHFKHGLASFIIALALFAYAWFVSGDKNSSHQH